MERRFRLGNEIANLALAPSLKFSPDGKHMILTFPIVSIETPSFDEEDSEEINPQRHTHRDIFEITGGTAFGSNLKASLVSTGKNESVLSVSMNVNSKVPGTGAAFAAVMNENGHTKAKKEK